MEEVYRIDEVACHKPWRYSHTHWTKDKAVFAHFVANKDKMWGEIYPPHVDEESPDFEHEAHEEDLYEWTEKVFIDEVYYPLILLGEVTIYAE